MVKLLNYLYKIEFSDWKLVVKEWSKHFVIHDYKNEIYKNILRKENLIWEKYKSFYSYKNLLEKINEKKVLSGLFKY